MYLSSGEIIAIIIVLIIFYVYISFKMYVDVTRTEVLCNQERIDLVICKENLETEYQEKVVAYEKEYKEKLAELKVRENNSRTYHDQKLAELMLFKKSLIAEKENLETEYKYKLSELSGQENKSRRYYDQKLKEMLDEEKRKMALEFKKHDDEFRAKKNIALEHYENSLRELYLSEKSKIENYNNKLAELGALKSRLEEEYATKVASLEEREVYLRNQESLAKENEVVWQNRLAQLTEKEKLTEAKMSNIPFIADVFAKIKEERSKLLHDHLMYKRNPAVKAAQEVATLSKENKRLTKLAKELELKNKYYEYIFPDLADDEDISLLKEPLVKSEKSEFDQAKNWLSIEEYKSLPLMEKYQLALDRYWDSSKSKHEIGKMYERYVGHLYEKEGYEVYYQGIKHGLSDLGIDLICRNKQSNKGTKLAIIQCKCWSKSKTIHEKHINQLFGTSIQYYLEHIDAQGDFKGFLKSGIRAVFITSTQLSDTARKFADSLNVVCRENVELKKYPMIKCNINKSTGERIYHLPFDQQYDSVKIDAEDEFYALTVAEAEENGFRRAKRWIK